jgi:hypothetical protein
MSAPAAMIATCVTATCHASITTAATTAMLARPRSGVSVRAMPQTAFATTATAATFKPWSQPASATPVASMTTAKSTSANAEGSVKPTHESTPPSRPARIMPMAMPTWLLAGPGRNWQSATRSA